MNILAKTSGLGLYMAPSKPNNKAANLKTINTPYEDEVSDDDEQSIEGKNIKLISKPIFLKITQNAQQ